MLNGTFGKPKSNSLMAEYSSLLGDAILRHRTRTAEHSARIESELASRVKSEFISNMSHELRTPLNTMIGFSKILAEHDRRRLPDDEIVEYAQLINDSAVHLLSVINDILDISKIQSGRYTIDAQEIAIEEVLEVCATSFRKVAFDAGVTLDLKLPPQLPRVRGDAAKLRQVFSNLVSNAIKFTPRNGSVALRGAPTKDGGLVIDVADTGIGMTEEEVTIALTPFGQVDGTRTRWREGAGLGLPIAQALVDLHGGRISVKSERGSGTVVSVMLPSRHRVTTATGRDMVLGNAKP
ncbi:MAG: sensor histidine kinase [Hyphomicrobiaceae bacterium]